MVDFFAFLSGGKSFLFFSFFFLSIFWSQIFCAPQKRL